MSPCAVFALVIVVLRALPARAISPGGNNVCDYTCQEDYYISEAYEESCGGFGWSSCQVTRKKKMTRDVTCHRCCPGWTSVGDSANCDIAKCFNIQPYGKCLNNGDCIRPDECTCPTGTRPGQCDDIDECSDNKGGCKDRCVNTVGSFYCECLPDRGLLPDQKTCAFTCFDHPAATCANSGVCVGKDQCECPEGTTQPRCDDIDECSTDQNKCEHGCVNEPLTFRCSCPAGYATLADKRTCGAVCFNHPTGSCLNSHKCVAPDECSCSEGFIQPDCADKDECINAKSHSCRQLCVNEIGSYSCACNEGYVLADDEVSCDDVDECVTANGGCAHTCDNSPGSFECGCNTGFLLAEDGINCDDVDECSTGQNECKDMTCLNTPGTYKCRCEEGQGWSETEHVCKPLCFGEEPGMCPNQGTCISTGVCECQSGYGQNNCTDIDECATNNGDCEFLCVNEIGSFFCDCLDGFAMVVGSKVCEDLNECELNSSICVLECINTRGSYACTCEQGFGWDNRTMACKPECFGELPGDCMNGGTCTGTDKCSCLEGYSQPRCEDTDECTGNASLCGVSVKMCDNDECAGTVSICELGCHNLMGSYRCDCEDGYNWVPVLKACKAVCGEEEPGVCPNGGVCETPGVCTCADGYEGNQCSDVDECSTGTAGCSVESCQNTPGSFICNCDAGFLWNPDQAACLADCGGPTSGGCSNGGTCKSPGVCACAPGFSEPKCSDEDECVGNHGCANACVNVNGSFYCEGDTKGYGIGPGQKTEKPVCVGSSPGTCPNGGACVQPDLCNCPSGYSLPHCSDLDECSSGEVTCSGNCVNVVGSYYCSSVEGYGRIPGETVDKPVCFGSLPGECPSGGECVSPGICTCEKGYQTPKCTDKNECLQNEGGCDTECVNIPGSYFCHCWEGYGKFQGDTNCKPVCRDSLPGRCPNGGTCSSPSVCRCAPGYQAPDCTDINECVEKNGGCELKCRNEQGAYSCECRPGFGWDRAQKICKPVCYDLSPGSCLNGGVCTAPDTCSCPPEFGTHNCADVNECTQIDHGCEFGCVNQLSGYYCRSDREGYGRLKGNNTDVPLCFGNTPGTCGNEGTCVGPGVCSCPAGYHGGDCEDEDECESVSCDGECVNRPGSYYCQGETGYGKGLNDEIFKSLCSENMPGLCDNGGTCVYPGTCSCPQGFLLPMCTDMNECEGPNNGGCGEDSCRNTPGSYQCVCAEGFGWEETKQLCLPVCYDLHPGTCNNKGTCTDRDTCTCADGYKTPDCSEINECTEMLVDCAGDCVNTVGSYFCASLTPGYGRNPGDTEDKPVCYGQSPGKCLNGGTCVTPNNCSCPEGYQTSDCSDVDECSDDNGGCQLQCTNTAGSYYCDCGQGYIWDDVHHACVAQCYGQTPGKCANNGTCMRPWICHCKPGFDVPTCSDIDECAVNNGGCGDRTCHNELGAYYCDCESGHGWHKDDKACKPECYDLPPGQCNNGGTCTAPDVCSCLDGYSTPECTDIDECRENNGDCTAECVNIAGAYYCKTDDGHGTLPGKTEKLPLCFTLPPGNCPNDGTCISPESCECKHGYMPPICDDYNECLQEDLCELDCHNTDGSYFCECHLGFVWDPSTQECKASCFDLPGGKCPNGGSCLRPGVCQCVSGFKVPDCSDVDECTEGSSPCELGCHNIVGSYSCDCHARYSWDKAAMSCLPVCFGLVGACRNDGKCKSPDTCSCASGFEPPRCTDIDECSGEDPVCPDGICTNVMGSYKCGCPSGHAWSSLMGACKPTCGSALPGVCPNGGTCIATEVCSCRDGFDPSQNCKDINECESKNGGCDLECVNLPGSHYCVCRDGFGKSPTDTECKPLCFGERPGSCPNGGECTTPGSCICQSGYTAPECNDKDECQQENGGCALTCHNVNGSHYCGCEDDYGWNPGLQSCQPICFGMMAGECPNGGKCVQPNVCSCLPGYGLPKCTDTDECKSDSHGCSQGCVNVKSTYYCLSDRAGYGRLPGQDRDTPICQRKLPGSCSNGGFCYAPNTCACPAGYRDADGDCVDVDECEESGRCTGLCLNLPGRYTCVCETGHSWDDVLMACKPVCDGHKPGKCLNDGKCTSPGVCQCLDGFQKPGCSDINECQTNSADECDRGCRNGNGFFFCIGQKPGYGRLPGETTERALCDQSQPPGKCQNGGTCVRPGTCQCPKGFVPPLCTDLNECEVDMPGCSTCENLVGGFSCKCDPGYEWTPAEEKCQALCYDFPAGTCANGGRCMEPYQCVCDVGYTLPQCHDDDECNRNKGGCSQFCNNTHGSFVCSCGHGYSLAGDRRMCTDTNECEVDNGGCFQKCINTPGAFECGCFAGYQTGQTTNDCIDVDECEEDNGGCAEKCVNTAGSYRCACFEGKAFGPGRVCLPVCYDYPVGTCGPNGVCSAPDLCDCFSGFEQPLCTDIDECDGDQGLGPCEHRCENTEGSFNCHCYRGYRLSDDHRSCHDIDECGRWPNPCHQVCNNTQGSFLCSCLSEYNLATDRSTCLKEDPCVLNNGGCPPSLRCVNTLAGISCDCHLGYIRGQQGVCEDFNECTENNGDCAHICLNTVGSHHCKCWNKFELVKDQRSCQWCDDEGHDLNCWSLCEQSEGSCVCPAGRYLHDDGLHCVATCPCENGGYCRTLFPDYLCNCDGTGFRGQTCSQPAVDIPSRIRLRVSSPRQVLVVVLLEEAVTIHESAPSRLRVSPENITIEAPSTREYLLLSTDTAGVYHLSFGLTGPDSHRFNQPILSTVFAGNIFVREQLYDYQIPNGCFRLDLTMTISGLGDTIPERHQLSFLSTSPWYQVSSLRETYFSHGSVLLVSGKQAEMPMFFRGLELAMEGRKLVLGPVSLFRKTFVGWEAGKTTFPKCETLELLPEDLSLLDNKHSIYNSLLHSLTSRLPPWISVSPAKGTLSYHDVFYPVLESGYLVRQIESCSTLPVREQGLYYTVRFNDPPRLRVFGHSVDLPHSGQTQEYCMVVSQAGDQHDLFAISFPDSAHTALKQLSVLQALRQGMGLDFSLKGLALSLSAGFTQSSATDTPLWNGARTFTLDPSLGASLWLSMDVTKVDADKGISLTTSLQAYSTATDVKQVLSDLLGRYSDVRVVLQDNFRAVLKMELLKEGNVIELTPGGQLAGLVSTGIRGDVPRFSCGQESNPEGVFLKVNARGTLLKTSKAVGNLTFLPTNLTYFAARLLTDNATMSDGDHQRYLEMVVTIIRVSEIALECLKSELIPKLDEDDKELMSQVSMLEFTLTEVNRKAKTLHTMNTSSDLVDFLAFSEDTSQHVSSLFKTTEHIKRRLSLTFQSLDQQMLFFSGNLTSLDQVSVKLINDLIQHSSSLLGELSEWAVKSVFTVTILGRMLTVEGALRYNEHGLTTTCEQFQLAHSLMSPPAALVTGIVRSYDSSQKSDSWVGRIWDRLDIHGGASLKLALSASQEEFVVQLEASLLNMGRFPDVKIIVDHNGISLEAKGFLWDSFPVSLKGFTLQEPPSPDDMWPIPLSGTSIPLSDASLNQQLGKALRLTLADRTKSFADRMKATRGNLQRARLAQQRAMVKFESGEKELARMELQYSYTKYTQHDDGSMKNLIHYLNSISNSVCQVSSCPLICLRGNHLDLCHSVIMYPCLLRNQCEHKAANLTCVSHNLDCLGVLKFAFNNTNAFEESLQTERLQNMMEETNLLYMEREEMEYRLAELRQKQEQQAYQVNECKQDVENIERHLVNIMEDDLHLMYLQDFISHHGVLATFQVADCGFELSTEDDNLHSVDVRCFVNPVLLGQRVTTFTFDFGDSPSGVWKLAQLLVTQLETSVKIILKEEKLSLTTDMYSFETIKESLRTGISSFHVDAITDVWMNRCNDFHELMAIIDTSIDTLLTITSALIHQANSVSAGDPSFPRSSHISASMVNITAALTQFYMTETQIKAATSSKQLTENKIIRETQSLFQFVQNSVTSSKSFVEDFPVLSSWQTKMDLMFREQSNFTRCFGVADCMKYGMSGLRMLMKVADKPKHTNAEQLVWFFDETVSTLLGTGDYSLAQTHKTVSQLQDQVKALNNEEWLCPVNVSTAATDDVVVAFGGDVKLSCPIKLGHTSRVIWLKDSIKYVSSGMDSSLTVVNASVKDEGKYSCRIQTHKGYHTSPPIHLTVRYPVVLSAPLPDEYQVIEGDTVLVKCASEGRPPRTTTWITNSHAKPESRDELHLANVSTTDSGIYRCDVRNLQGQDTSGEMFLAVWRARAICPTVRYRFRYISGPKVIDNKKMVDHQPGTTMQEEFSRALSAVFHDKTNTFFLYDVRIMEYALQGEFSVRSVKCQNGGYCHRSRCEQLYHQESLKLRQFLAVFQAIRESVFLFEARRMYYYFNSAYFNEVSDEPVCLEGQRKAGRFVCVVTSGSRGDEISIPYPIGKPVNVTVTPTHVQWAPPLNGADFVKGYRVVVTDIRSLEVVVDSNTTAMIYSLQFDVTKGSYGVKVQAFSSRHSGEEAVVSSSPPQSDDQSGLIAGVITTVALLSAAMLIFALLYRYKKRKPRTIAPSPSSSTADLMAPKSSWTDLNSKWNSISNGPQGFESFGTGSPVPCNKPPQSYLAIIQSP